MDGKSTDYLWEYTGKLNDAGVVPPAEAIAAGQADSAKKAALSAPIG